MSRRIPAVCTAILIFFRVSQALACDLCAIYTAGQTKNGSGQGLSMTVAEQFTGFHRLQDDGKHVENNGHQSLTSSITQLVGRYDFTPKLGLQLAVPFISRHFKRPEGSKIESGSESGLGDVAVLAIFTPYHTNYRDFLVRWNVQAGIKLPTGDTDRLKEETEEEEEGAHQNRSESENASRHGSAALLHAGHVHTPKFESGIHGHDLTLGSGSWDYVFGTGVVLEKGRFFTAGNIQYMQRSEGDFDYRFQNDLIWDTGIGAYFLLQHQRTASLKANLSGEYKGMDVFRGNKAEDTGVNSMFLGPELSYTEGAHWHLQLGLDLPLFVDNTALQIVPNYRFRANVTYRY